VAEGTRHLQIKRGAVGGICVLMAGELGLATDTGALYSSLNGSDNVIIGGTGVLRDLAAGITLSNADLTLKGAPTTDNMAATKAYVDAARMGLDVKGSVHVATTEAGTLASSFANGSVVDGVTLVTGDRILIKNQATGAENGIYTVKASGAPDRAVDMPAGAGYSTGAYMFVEEGTLHHTGWIMTNEAAVEIGATALVFAQFNATGSTYTASLGVELSTLDFRLDLLANAGLALTGNEVGIKLNATAANLELSSDGIAIKKASAQYKFLMSGGTPFDYAETAVSALAGAGLGCTNGVLAVGEGTLIDVAADTVGLHAGAADYQFITTGTTPWTPGYANIATLAGVEATTGLLCAAGVLSVGNIDCGAFA
jgi:hypothetical protein